VTLVGPIAYFTRNHTSAIQYFLVLLCVSSLTNEQYLVWRFPLGLRLGGLFCTGIEILDLRSFVSLPPGDYFDFEAKAARSFAWATSASNCGSP
jgi:hypothetical protein